MDEKQKATDANVLVYLYEVTLKQAIRPHIDEAVTGSLYHQNRLLEAVRPFVVEHLKAGLYCPEMYVEDVAQEVMIGVFKSLDKGRLRWDGASRYIFTIAKNKCFDYQMKYGGM